jgi:hypothetical protein
MYVFELVRVKSFSATFTENSRRKQGPGLDRCLESARSRTYFMISAAHVRFRSGRGAGFCRMPTLESYR